MSQIYNHVAQDGVTCQRDTITWLEWAWRATHKSRRLEWVWHTTRANSWLAWLWRAIRYHSTFSVCIFSSGVRQQHRYIAADKVSWLPRMVLEPKWCEQHSDLTWLKSYFHRVNCVILTTRELPSVNSVFTTCTTLYMLQCHWLMTVRCLSHPSDRRRYLCYLKTPVSSKSRHSCLTGSIRRVREPLRC